MLVRDVLVMDVLWGALPDRGQTVEGPVVRQLSWSTHSEGLLDAVVQSPPKPVTCYNLFHSVPFSLILSGAWTLSL